MAYPFQAATYNSNGTGYPFAAVKDIGKYVAPSVSVDTTIAPYSGSDKGTKVSSGGDPAWMEALYALGSMGKGVTNQLANWSDGENTWKSWLVGNDNPFIGMWDVTKTGLQGQLDYWKDGRISLSDVPVIGSMSAIGKNAPGFEQTLKNRGVTNERALFWGGLAGDLATDPTTYLTFGAGSAIKAGTKGMQKTATEIAKEFGIKTSARTGYKTLPQQVSTKVLNDALEKGIAPEIAQDAASRAASSVTQRIEDAGKLGRYNAQNSLVNLDIPFMTRPTINIGKKPAALTKSSPKVGEAGTRVIERALERAGLVGKQGEEFVQKALGKSIPEMTYQEFKWLKSEIPRYGEHASRTSVFDGALNALNNPMDTFSFGKFVPDMGGRSPVGQRIADVFSLVNPRNVGTRNSAGLVRAQGDAIQDAMGAVRGSDRLATMNLKELQNIFGAKNPTLEESKLMEGLLEGTLQDSAGISSNVRNAVNYMKNTYKEAAEAEKGVGALTSTREAYAPHIINYGDDKMNDILKKYADDPELQQLAKLRATNKSSKKRTSFQTFAQLDNYLAKLDNAFQNETDPALKLAISEKYEDVANIFERDPFKAFQRRMQQSYKTQALGKLYKDMESDGILLTPDIKDYDSALYERLEPEIASKLNVAPGTVMNKEVKAALIQANKLFTSEGLNKMVDNMISVTNAWKALSTVYRPVHHLNNLVGNLFNNGLAGVTPKAYKNASATLNRIARGKMKQEDIDIMSEAVKSGIFGHTYSAEFRRVFESQPANKLRKIESAVTDNRYSNWMRKWLGDSTDNWSRLAHYMHVKERTGSAAAARDSVRKYLFNYGEQTTAEQAARLVMPFWIWTRNNIPLQIEQMLQQPRYYQTYLKLQDASYEAYGTSRDDQKDYIAEGYFATPWGTARNPRAPVTDLTNISSPAEALQFGASSLNPIPRIGLELAANKRFFNQTPIDRQRESNGGYSPAALGEYAIEQVTPLNDIYKLFSGKTSPLDMLFGRELELNK